MGLVAAHYCGAPWRRVAARRRCRCVDANLEREIDGHLLARHLAGLLHVHAMPTHKLASIGSGSRHSSRRREELAADGIFMPQSTRESE